MKDIVIISGITGFVGTNLKQYLISKFSIIGISRQKKNNYFSFEEIEIPLLNQSKAFIHLAGKAHDLKKTSEEKEYFEANTELTKKIFRKFLKSNCEVFVYMSSVKAAADSVNNVLFEDHSPNPQTPYGKSKLASEEFILKQSINNKRVYILRPCMIHGPNNKGNLNLLFNFVNKGIPYPFGAYENLRSFVSIENLCFIINELIINNKVPNGIYNISDNKPISTNKLVKIIGKTIKKSTTILKIPKFIIISLAKLGDFLPIPINTERLEKLTENYIVSNQKINNVINKDLPITTEKGIEITIKSFLQK